MADQVLPPPALDPFVLAGTDSASAQTLLNRAFPGTATEPVPLVVTDDTDLGSGAGRMTVTAVRDGGGAVPGVNDVRDCPDNPDLLAEDGRATIVQLDAGRAVGRRHRHRQRDSGRGHRRCGAGLADRSRRDGRLPGLPDLAHRHPHVRGPGPDAGRRRAAVHVATGLAGGDPAGHRTRGRRDRPGHHRPARPAGLHPRGGPDAGHDARPGRGDRLRAVPGDPAPHAAAPRLRRTGRGRAHSGHGRGGHGLRGGHTAGRGHRAGAHRHLVPGLDGLLRGARGGPGAVGGAHARARPC